MSNSIDVIQTDQRVGGCLSLAKGADIGDYISTAENRVAGWYLPQSSLR
jgi:hypothetical protein